MTESVVQVVLGEEKGGAGMLGEVVIDAIPLDGVRITPTGLELTDPELPLTQWMQIGRMVGYMHRSVNWWIGDWINKGEALYGQEAYQGIESTVSERYNEAERVTGIAHDTLLHIASICGRVLRSNRRAELGFWIHAEVAKLDPEQQAEWLARAVEEGWRREDLRKAMRDAGRKELFDDDGGSGGDGTSDGDDWDKLSRTERIEQAARRVFHQGVVRGAEARVPLEPWHMLASSLGEE